MYFRPADNQKTTLGRSKLCEPGNEVPSYLIVSLVTYLPCLNMVSTWMSTVYCFDARSLYFHLLLPGPACTWSVHFALCKPLCVELCIALVASTQLMFLCKPVHELCDMVSVRTTSGIGFEYRNTIPLISPYLAC